MAEGLVGAEGFAVDASLIPPTPTSSARFPARTGSRGDQGEAPRRARISRDARRRGVRRGLPCAAEVHLPIRSGSPVDGAHKGHAFFAYSTNYLIDTDHGVIVDVEATRAIRQAEVGAARTMLERTESRFGVKPGYLTADTAYGSAENLAWLVKQKQITPLIPVFDKSNRTDGTFSRSDFTFDPERDRYTCPAGKELVQFRRTYATPRTGVTLRA